MQRALGSRAGRSLLAGLTKATSEKQSTLSSTLPATAVVPPTLPVPEVRVAVPSCGALGSRGPWHVRGVLRKSASMQIQGQFCVAYSATWQLPSPHLPSTTTDCGPLASHLGLPCTLQFKAPPSWTWDSKAWHSVLQQTATTTAQPTVRSVSTSSAAAAPPKVVPFNYEDIHAQPNKQPIKYRSVL